LALSYTLKLSIENCGQTAADKDMVTTGSLYEVAVTLYDGTIAGPYDLPFSHNWHTIGYPMSMICMLFQSQYATFY